ncbi:hypothetical protein EVAR_70958_1, partial [Eumeta japonica]
VSNLTRTKIYIGSVTCRSIGHHYSSRRRRRVRRAAARSCLIKARTNFTPVRDAFDVRLSRTPDARPSIRSAPRDELTFSRRPGRHSRLFRIDQLEY